MRKFIIAAACLWGLGAALPASGFADDGRRFAPGAIGRQKRVESHQRQVSDLRRVHEPEWKRWRHTKGEVAHAVPELDPSVGGTAIALLAAATALLLERRRTARV